jgi:integrase/recombinase XerD
MSTQVPQGFAVLLQRFFLQRLIQQQHVTARTVTAYRDSFRLLLGYAHRQLGKQPSDVVLEDLNPTFILAFLAHLEVDRHNCARSRNARFATIRSFMEYVSFEEPSALALAQSVLAITTLYNTGARVSELIGMRISDVTLEPTSWVRIRGKGRKSHRTLKTCRPRRSSTISGVGQTARFSPPVSTFCRHAHAAVRR